MRRAESGSPVGAAGATPLAWSDPGIESVMAAVHRLPLPLVGDALRAVNVYVLEGTAGLTLVDSGWDHPLSWQALGDGLATIGAEVGDVRDVLVTHVHRDHFGQATGIARASGATVRLDRREWRSFQRMARPPRTGFHRRMLGLQRGGAQALITEAEHSWRTPQRADVEEPAWMDDVRTIELDDRELEVIRTPGHTWGHVCFYDRTRGLLFAGDHVLPHITPSIGVETPQMRLSLAHFLRSLALVRNLPVTRVLPAHGPLFADLAGRVDELVEHHATRLETVCSAVIVGDATGYEVAQRILWTRRGRAFTELDLFNRMLAVREAMAHLDLLVSQRRLRVDEGEDCVARFAPCAELDGG